jgi:hypothetical protein
MNQTKKKYIAPVAAIAGVVTECLMINSARVRVNQPEYNDYNEIATEMTGDILL